ncbi:MAG: hypothetical protein KDD64_01160 [Bdellovibrionales bacterium]|nr:hypothetical protein [Bdellovibrionales bacterium]
MPALKLDSLLIAHLSKQLTQGDPLIALARLNEYLEPHNPLRQAFVSRVQTAIGEGAAKNKAVNAILSGKRFRELNNNSREQILEFKRKTGSSEQTKSILNKPSTRGTKMRRPTPYPNFHAFRQRGTIERRTRTRETLSLTAIRL